ncbi:MAG: hypothetical protein AUJ34_02165 [Parcubacteria group bacterium CG1_02_41_12]|nr:MAG: hypothetical protein AUJ34_02165 [Parcubacteria group bacterium CG1_02_41_12]
MSNYSKHMPKKLKIAIFCTTTDTVPPSSKVIHAPLWLTYYLANLLAEKGHEVTLIAAPKSKSRAKIINKKITDLKRNKTIKELIQRNLIGTSRRVMALNDQTALLDAYTSDAFDIVHAHTELSLPLAALSKIPTLITYHSSYDEFYNKLFAYYKNNFKQIYFNSLSNRHSHQAPLISFIQTVHNGIDLKNFSFNKKPKKDLLFVGRIIEEKGPDTAIMVAKKIKLPLELIGEKFAPKGQREEFWNNKIQKYLSNNIQYKGIQPHKKTKQYYQNAKILLFPDRWKEAFGLVMIESMACGTPVIAFNKGAVLEIVKHGITGYVVKNEKQMIGAVKKIYSMKEDEYIKMRYACREHVEKNFSVEKMVDNYEKLYYKIIEQHKNK